MNDPFGINDIYLEEVCSHSGCIQPAVEQNPYEADLCRLHADYEDDWDDADNLRDRLWEDDSEQHHSHRTDPIPQHRQRRNKLLRNRHTHPESGLDHERR